jgi:hypothetical protein
MRRDFAERARHRAGGRERKAVLRAGRFRPGRAGYLVTTMPSEMWESADLISCAEAAHILGCSEEIIRRHLLAGRLHDRPGVERPAMSRVEVEAMACELYPWRRHVHDPRSYWVTGAQAAGVLGVSMGRLDQLSDARRIPFVRHEDRTRLYRRRQLEQLPHR